MAVKIIQQRPLRFRCYHCGTLFEFEKSDTQRKMTYGYNMQASFEDFINCPGCRHEIQVSDYLNQ